MDDGIFKKQTAKCAESFEKWANECGFDSRFICPVILDFYLAWEFSNNTPESEVLDLISKLYRIGPVMFKKDSDEDDDHDEYLSEDIDQKLDKFSKILEKMLELEKMRSEKK